MIVKGRSEGLESMFRPGTDAVRREFRENVEMNPWRDPS
jgi:hypothetical protein